MLLEEKRRGAQWRGRVVLELIKPQSVSTDQRGSEHIFLCSACKARILLLEAVAVSNHPVKTHLDLQHCVT